MSCDRTDTCPACHEYGLKQYFDFTYAPQPYYPEGVQALSVGYKAICGACGWVHEACMVTSVKVPVNAPTVSDKAALEGDDA